MELIVYKGLLFVEPKNRTCTIINALLQALDQEGEHHETIVIMKMI